MRSGNMLKIMQFRKVVVLAHIIIYGAGAVTLVRVLPLPLRGVINFSALRDISKILRGRFAL
jgi:hypothetical protein